MTANDVFTAMLTKRPTKNVYLNPIDARTVTATLGLKAQDDGVIEQRFGDLSIHSDEAIPIGQIVFK